MVSNAENDKTMRTVKLTTLLRIIPGPSSSYVINAKGPPSSRDDFCRGQQEERFKKFITATAPSVGGDDFVKNLEVYDPELSCI